MNHDIASDLLWAVSSLTDLIVRQNVVCTTYVSARRQCQREMWDDRHGIIPQETKSVEQLGHTLAGLTTEMHSIACEHREASSAIERCAQQLCQPTQELTLSNLEVIMALLQSLIQSSEVVFSRVELLNEFRDAAEMLLRHGAIKSQTIAFVAAFDEVIGAYNYQWFAANDMVAALKLYVSAAPSLQQPAEDEPQSMDQPASLPATAALPSLRIEIEWKESEQTPPAQSRVHEEITARICEMESVFALAHKRAKELREQTTHTRAQCAQLKATTGRMYYEATQTFSRAKELHDEAQQTLLWLRSL